MRRFWGCGAVALALAVPAQARSLQQAQAGKVVLEVLPRVTVTVLVDNMAGSRAVLGEWGAAFLIETDQHQILFDVGAGQTLLGNARALGVNLARTEAIAISHEHGDHTEGLDSALSAVGSVDLFVHPAAFDTRYWRAGDRAAPHTMPLSRQQLSQRVRRLIETKGPTSIREGLMVTGEIPRVTDFEDTGVRESAFLDASMETPDPILDDQAVFFRVPEGLVIVLGCGHAGLVNTMRYVSELTGESRIFAIIGGTHLVSASPARMQRTVEALREFDVQKIMLSHCTGAQAFADLAKAFPGRSSWPASGTRIRFGG